MCRACGVMIQTHLPRLLRFHAMQNLVQMRLLFGRTFAKGITRHDPMHARGPSVLFRQRTEHESATPKHTLERPRPDCALEPQRFFSTSHVWHGHAKLLSEHLAAGSRHAKSRANRNLLPDMVGNKMLMVQNRNFQSPPLLRGFVFGIRLCICQTRPATSSAALAPSCSADPIAGQQRNHPKE
jgi:hypothetical protein